MESRHSHKYQLAHNGKEKSDSLLSSLWDSFWNPPHLNCPKCGSATVEYYDPFFFSPVRSLKGTRRVKCSSCRFIWRPSRRRRSLFKGLWPFGLQ